MRPQWPSWKRARQADRKSTRLNSSHTEIYTLSLHDALPILGLPAPAGSAPVEWRVSDTLIGYEAAVAFMEARAAGRSEEHTSELQSHRDLHSFPTRRSSDLGLARACRIGAGRVARERYAHRL